MIKIAINNAALHGTAPGEDVVQALLEEQLTATESRLRSQVDAWWSRYFQAELPASWMGDDLATEITSIESQARAVLERAAEGWSALFDGGTSSYAGINVSPDKTRMTGFVRPDGSVGVPVDDQSISFTIRGTGLDLDSTNYTIEGVDFEFLIPGSWNEVASATLDLDLTVRDAIIEEQPLSFHSLDVRVGDFFHAWLRGPLTVRSDWFPLVVDATQSRLVTYLDGWNVEWGASVNPDPKYSEPYGFTVRGSFYEALNDDSSYWNEVRLPLNRIDSLSLNLGGRQINLDGLDLTSQTSSFQIESTLRQRVYDWIGANGLSVDFGLNLGNSLTVDLSNAEIRFYRPTSPTGEYVPAYLYISEATLALEVDTQIGAQRIPLRVELDLGGRYYVDEWVYPRSTGVIKGFRMESAPSSLLPDGLRVHIDGIRIDSRNLSAIDTTSVYTMIESIARLDTTGDKSMTIVHDRSLDLTRMDLDGFSVSTEVLAAPVEADVYHWKSRALLDQVWRTEAGTAVRPTGDGTANSGITSADALAALRIAVGLNPNVDPDGDGPQPRPAISPYQLMAADVNGNGSVTSADALAILRMAVKLSTATPQEWFFVEETRDFWNEEQGVFTLSRTDANWDPVIPLDAVGAPATRLVGVLKGDVNGSWAAAVGAATLPDGYLPNLASLIGLPSIEQWGG